MKLDPVMATEKVPEPLIKRGGGVVVEHLSTASLIQLSWFSERIIIHNNGVLSLVRFLIVGGVPERHALLQRCQHSEHGQRTLRTKGKGAGLVEEEVAKDECKEVRIQISVQ